MPREKGIPRKLELRQIIIRQENRSSFYCSIIMTIYCVCRNFQHKPERRLGAEVLSLSNLSPRTSPSNLLWYGAFPPSALLPGKLLRYWKACSRTTLAKLPRKPSPGRIDPSPPTLSRARPRGDKTLVFGARFDSEFDVSMGNASKHFPLALVVRLRNAERVFQSIPQVSF